MFWLTCFTTNDCSLYTEIIIGKYEGVLLKDAFFLLEASLVEIKVISVTREHLLGNFVQSGPAFVRNCCTLLYF